MEHYISPSMLSVDFSKIGEELKKLEDAGTPYIHLDVMDGVFVPNISFGMPVIKSLRKTTKMVFDTHLMIVEPERYIEDIKKAGADIVTFHVEAAKDPQGAIDKIHGLGMKAGLTLKPNTPIETIKPFITSIDMALVMTVEPGFGGQKFMAEQVPKIKQLRAWREEMGLSYDIEVDGGITLDNVRVALEAGANVIVAGSAVFGKEDIGAAARDFMRIFKEYE